MGSPSGAFSAAVARFASPGALALSLAITYLLYGPSLGFGFAFDDPYDLPRAAGHGFGELLTSSADYGYYRPLPFLLWRALILARGGFDPVALHLPNLVAHASNGWLVYLLGSRLAGRAFGILGLLFFLFFPQSFQAVPNINAVFHPLVTLLVLSALLLYWEWRCRGRNWLLVASLLAAVAALFTHEYGVAVAPLALALELYMRRRQADPVEGRCHRYGSSWWLLAYFGVALGFFLVWRAVPKWSNPLALSSESWAQNGLFLAQGLAWPVTRQLGSVSELMEEGLEGKLSLVIGVTVLAMAGLYWRRRQLPLFGLGLFWFVVSVAPTWAILPFSYLIDGNRLLYLASVGISWLWAGLWLAGPRQRRFLLLWRGGMAAIVGFLLWQSGQSIELRHQMYALGTALTRDLARLSVGQGSSLVVVNFPSWFAPRQAEFPYGHSGVTTIPSYLGLGRAIYLVRGDEPDALSLGYEDLLRPQSLHFGLHGEAAALETVAGAARSAGAVFLVAYDADRLEVLPAGRRRAGAGSDVGSLVADFEGRFRLTRAEIAPRQRDLRLGLTWEIIQADGADYTIFVHLYNEEGQLLAQADGYPLRGLFPLRLGRSGEILEEWRDILVGPHSPPGGYRVAVGIYERQTGRRLPARDPSGRLWPDGAVTIGQVSLP